MAVATVETWTDEFRTLCNGDAELQAHGKHNSFSMLLDMEEHSYLIEVIEGKVTSALTDPGPLDRRYQFAIRASAETWREFAEETPRPMFHGIWAASFQEDMQLEGDLLVLMQNLRYVTRQLELLRETGAPVSG